MPSTLAVAALSCASGPDIRRNATLIAEAIDAAAAANARLLVTPECALVGYPGEAREDLDSVDWRALASREDELAERALERGLLLALGSASPWRDGVSNDLLLCGAVAGEQRYRKRCLTSGDRDHFLPGEEGITATCAGWRIGVGICFDIRFADLWLELAAAGCDLFVNAAHMAGVDPEPGSKSTVIPQHYASRAAELATPMLLANTSASDRWLDSGLWDCRGLQVAALGEGLLLAQVEARDLAPAFYADIRAQALLRWRERGSVW